MSDIYPSTMALSVYNVLSLTKRDLARNDIDHFLRSGGALGPNIDADYVDRGIAYLVAESLAKVVDGVVVVPRMPGGSAKPVCRANGDRDIVKAAF